MATVEKRYNKNGEISHYRITVAQGIDTNGVQIRRRMNWKPPKPDMTEKQLAKALNKAVTDFEREINQGFELDRRQTFASYAEYVIELKERTGIRPRTIDRYRDLLRRINKAIGHLKLTDIRPQHLNAFYKNLGEKGIRENADRAASRIDLKALLKENNITIAGLSRESKVAEITIRKAIKGENIYKDKAEAIAAAVGKKVTDIFDIKEDNEPLSDKTILEHHRLISTIMSQAEKEMLIPFNPAAKATPPKVTKKDPDYYQPEEIDAVLDALDKAPLKWKAITYLLIDTGCRRGEAAGLKWESVDLNSGIITIERALLYSPKRGVYEGPPKNGKVRTVGIAPETVTLLRWVKSEQSRLQQLNGDRWVDSGYVFTQDNGDRINPESITAWLRTFSASEETLKHLHPHAFRHTAASTMIANGVDLVTTANELGHSNATTTATIYAHQISEAKAKAENVRADVFKRRKQA